MERERERERESDRRGGSGGNVLSSKAQEEKTLFKWWGIWIYSPLFIVKVYV